MPDSVAVNHHHLPVQIKVSSHRNDSPGGSSGGEHKQTCSWWRNRGGENDRRCHRCSQVLLLLLFFTSRKSLSSWTLSVSSTRPEDQDHHPERRMKAAFSAYEEANMPRLKKENPNMRLSQLKQQLKKEWMKAPENPLNQCFAAYNSKWEAFCNLGALLGSRELN